MNNNKIIQRLGDSQIGAALAPFGISPSAELCANIRDYTVLLLQWNQKVSLTSVVEPLALLARHFGESLYAAHAVPIEGRRLADVGSGAGFPALALKLVLPGTEVTLIEANAKKAAFLAEAVRVLRLQGVRILHARTDLISPGEPLADCITARAIGQFPSLLGWSAKALAPGGKVVLWVTLDHVPAIQAIPDWTWQKPIPVPQSQRRVLLVGCST